MQFERRQFTALLFATHSRRWAAAIALTACGLACAQDAGMSLVGLSDGKAVVAGSDGRPKVYRIGDVLPNGARLIQANAQEATVQLGAKKQVLTMGGQIALAPVGSTNARVTLTADAQGHFQTLGTIDGASVRFLVDTGATMISMGIADARRIGIDYTKGQPGFASTANGTAKVYRVKLNTVKVGDIVINAVDALVHETDMGIVLLGMSFLNRVEMQRQGDALTLVKRF